jgi:hypothetical protein
VRQLGQEMNFDARDPAYTNPYSEDAARGSPETREARVKAFKEAQHKQKLERIRQPRREL